MNRRTRESRRRWQRRNQSTRRVARWWRVFPPYLEQLEERMLLTSLSPTGYSQVSPVWFESLVADVPSLAAASLSEQPETSNDDRWIVRLTEQAVLQTGTVRAAASLLNESDSELQVLRGLGLPGQLLVRAGGQERSVVEAALRSQSVCGVL